MLFKVKSLLSESFSKLFVNFTKAGFLLLIVPISSLKVVISNVSSHSLTIQVQYFFQISQTIFNTCFISSGVASVTKSISHQVLSSHIIFSRQKPQTMYNFLFKVFSF
ncbi:MAG: hypothetical protein Q8S84_03230 [bacterium]|nr:hypothetical protein [bacterium]